MRSILIVSILAFSLTSCKKSLEKEKGDYVKLKSTEINSEVKAERGQMLMVKQCYLCHNPKTEEGSRIAPPFIAIKNHYLKKSASEQDFVQLIWSFVEKPTNEKTLMKGAVEKFGLMPYQVFKEDEVKAIAKYLYTNDIEKPERYQEHHNQKHGNGKGYGQRQGNNQPKSDIELGMHYASTTKALLGQNLMGTIQKQGVRDALSFCNVQAMPLTDSMSTKYNASIKRASENYRNPINKANAEELKYIAQYKQSLKNGEEPEPVLVDKGQKVNFYYPIFTNDMCLKCHGTPGKQIQPETYDQIKKLYPQDKAIGYQVNEVRGIWSISFDSND